MTDVPGTSPERPIIWSPGRPATGSRRRPVDVPIQNFCIFVFPVKNSNRCVKQGLLHLKNTFFIKSSIFLLVPQSPLKVPWRSQTLGRPRNVACQLGYLQKQGLEAVNSFLKNIPSEMSSLVVNTPLDKLRSLLHVKIKCQLTNSFRRSCSLCSVYKFLLKVTILVHFYFLGSLN